MKGSWKTCQCIFFILGVLFTLGFSPKQPLTADPRFSDNFEGYTSASETRKAYTPWDGGAVLEVSLETDAGSPPDKSLGIRVVSPNLQNGSVNGSVYHLLKGSQRDWSGATGVRFKVTNPSGSPLMLSLNFKESYNEYWAVAQSGFFYLESDDGSLAQRDIAYSNLVIPENYNGRVVLPFSSFAVPDWNTARGNKQMDLQNIESIAIGVNAGQATPRFFTVDDFELLAPAKLYPLEIHGTNVIAVPRTGAHIERYTVTYGNPGDSTSLAVQPAWSIVEPADPAVKIDSQGYLSVSPTATHSRVIIAARYNDGERPLSAEYHIQLTGIENPADTTGAAETTAPVPQPAESDYDRLSRNFEAWAVQNRPLFVVLSVSAIFIFLVLLSILQQRLK